MKNKKILLMPLFALSVATLSSCLLTAKDRKQNVDPSTHVHHASEEYKFDEYGHYHICNCGLEEPRYDYAAHDYETKDGYPTCKVCGYVDDSKDASYREVQAALNEFFAYKGNLSFVAETNNRTLLLSGAVHLSDVATQKATLDRENGRYYSKTTTDSIDREGTETNTEEYVLSTNENADSEYRYYEIDDSAKSYYAADEGYASYLFDGLFTDIDGEGVNIQQYAKWIANNAKMDDFLAAYPSLISQVGLYGCNAYKADGLATLEITFGYDDYSSDTAERYDLKVLFYAKDGLLSGFEVKNVYCVTHPNAKTGDDADADGGEVDDHSYKVTFNRELDSELSAECLSKIDGSADSGTAAEVAVDIYYVDYLWENSITAKIGSPITWEYGDAVTLYTDKDRSTPYVDQPIGSDSRTLYAKINDKMPDASSTYAAIVIVEDIKIIDTNSVEETHRKIFNSVTLYDTSAVTNVLLPWRSGTDDDCEEVSQVIWINDKLRTKPSDGGQSLDIEAGKIYTVINSHTSFTWIQD